jgi:hypothetical protein
LAGGAGLSLLGSIVATSQKCCYVVLLLLSQWGPPGYDIGNVVGKT